MSGMIYNIYMRAEIISIGTELLLGHIINTNTAYLSQKMAEAGIDVYRHTAVGDNPERLVSCIREALSRSDMVVTTGGLGPTVDDITLHSIARVLDSPLIFKKALKNYILGYFKKRKIKTFPEETLRQTYIPKGAVWFKNEHGTAPGILVEKNKKILIALPGPPREMRPLIKNAILPCLKRKGLVGNYIIKTRTLKVAGLVEVEVNKIVKDLLSMGPHTTLGIYVRLGEVDLRITTKAKNRTSANKKISEVERKIRKRLGNFIYGADNETLESIVGKKLRSSRQTLATCESCTGGLIGNRITNVSGSSDYFKLGVVAYSNSSKIKLLGLSPKTIKKHGAVSKETALFTAGAIRKIAKTDIGLSVTGIAGPSGGTKRKPVGLVYIALINNKVKMVKECHFQGTREDIKSITATTALNLLRTLF